MCCYSCKIFVIRLVNTSKVNHVATVQYCTSCKAIFSRDVNSSKVNHITYIDFHYGWICCYSCKVFKVVNTSKVNHVATIATHARHSLAVSSILPRYRWIMWQIFIVTTAECSATHARHSLDESSILLRYCKSSCYYCYSCKVFFRRVVNTPKVNKVTTTAPNARHSSDGLSILS
jgi:hypothetical protein